MHHADAAFLVPIRLSMSCVNIILDGATVLDRSEGIGLLSLTDREKTRQITIICEKRIAEEISKRISKVNPIGKMLLPEVAAQIIATHQEDRYQVVIYNIKDGQYSTYILNQTSGEVFPIRVSDAILFAIVAGMPIMMNEELFLRQSVEYTESATSFKIPINAISIKALNEYLDKALAEENYELAAKLRDELKKRK